MDPEIEKDAAHVARIEGRRDAAAKRLHEEGKRSSPIPKKLKKRSAARPGGAATLAPLVDDDPSGDGMGQLAFLGEPGFTSSALPSCPITLGVVDGESVDMCQEADADDDENSYGEWYMLSRVSDTGVGYTHSKYLIQGAFETAALRSLYETHESASLTNYGWGAEGAAALESALMMMVRVEPRVEPAPIESEPMPALVHDDGRAFTGPWNRSYDGDAKRLRQEVEDEQREVESRAQAMHDSRAAPVDEAPSLKYFVVWGGKYEGVHGIFDMATELQPLIEMPGARAYGAADGVTSKEFAEMKLRAMQNAREAQQRQDGTMPLAPTMPDRTSRRATVSPERVVQATIRHGGIDPKKREREKT